MHQHDVLTLPELVDVARDRLDLIFWSLVLADQYRAEEVCFSLIELSVLHAQNVFHTCPTTCSLLTLRLLITHTCVFEQLLILWLGLEWCVDGLWFIRWQLALDALSFLNCYAFAHLVVPDRDVGNWAVLSGPTDGWLQILHATRAVVIIYVVEYVTTFLCGGLWLDLIPHRQSLLSHVQEFATIVVSHSILGCLMVFE